MVLLTTETFDAEKLSFMTVLSERSNLLLARYEGEPVNFVLRGVRVPFTPTGKEFAKNAGRRYNFPMSLDLDRADVMMWDHIDTLCGTVCFDKRDYLYSAKMAKDFTDVNNLMKFGMKTLVTRNTYVDDKGCGHDRDPLLTAKMVLQDDVFQVEFNIANEEGYVPLTLHEESVPTYIKGGSTADAIVEFVGITVMNDKAFPQLKLKQVVVYPPEKMEIVDDTLPSGKLLEILGLKKAEEVNVPVEEAPKGKRARKH